MAGPEQSWVQELRPAGLQGLEGAQPAAALALEKEAAQEPGQPLARLMWSVQVRKPGRGVSLHVCSEQPVREGGRQHRGGLAAGSEESSLVLHTPGIRLEIEVISKDFNALQYSKFMILHIFNSRYPKFYDYKIM